MIFTPIANCTLVLAYIGSPCQLSKLPKQSATVQYTVISYYFHSLIVYQLIIVLAQAGQLSNRWLQD